MKTKTERHSIDREYYSLAESRTKPIREHYLSVMAGQSALTEGSSVPQYSIGDLAAACYLQGLVDAGTALSNAGTITLPSSEQ